MYRAREPRVKRREQVSFEWGHTVSFFLIHPLDLSPLICSLPSYSLNFLIHYNLIQRVLPLIISKTKGPTQKLN